jgi:GAF domain-containing protein
LIDAGEIELCFKHVNEIVTETLEVERSGIWFYNKDKSIITSQDTYVRTSKQHSSGLILESQNLSTFFNFLQDVRARPVLDAHTDPLVGEFTEVYLKPNDIQSLLDAPIIVGGNYIGVICCENVGRLK